MQARECREWAKSLGWDVVRIYKDEGFSGTTLNRPAFLEMVDDARAAKFHRIVVYHVDRWGRSAGDVALKEELQNLGIRFAYRMQNKADDDGSDLGIQVEELMARNFSKTLSKRTSAGQHEKVRQGRIGFGGRPPYGYAVEYQGKARNFVPHPEAAHVVKKIFELYASGQTIRGVATWLNQSRLPTSSLLNGTNRSSSPAGHWYPNKVHEILTNPMYTGDLVIGRHKLVQSQNGKRTSKQVKDRAAWTVTPDALPALIDRETFEAAQARFKDNKRYKRSSDHPGNPLSGKLGKCLNCGGSVNIERNHPESSTKKAKYYYFCVKYRRERLSPKETCGAAIAYDEVIDCIRSGIALYLAATNREAIQRAISGFNRKATSVEDTPEVKAARSLLSKLERQKANVLNAITNSEEAGSIPELAHKLRDLSEEHSKQKAFTAELESEHRKTVELMDEKNFLHSARQIRQRLRDNAVIPSDLLRAVFARIHLDFRKRERRPSKRKLESLSRIAGNVKQSRVKQKAAAEELSRYYAVTTPPGANIRIHLVPRFNLEGRLGFKTVPESAVHFVRPFHSKQLGDSKRKRD